MCLFLQVLDASKAEMLRAQVLGSDAHQHATPDSSASLKDPACVSGMTGPAAASQLPLDGSLEPLPDQAMPEAFPDQAMPRQEEEEASAKGGVPEQAAPDGAAQHSESPATDALAMTHGKKRKADKECVRAAADTDAAAALECEGAGVEISSASHAADEPKQATSRKIGGSKKAHQGTLQAAFAKAKVLDSPMLQHVWL